MKIIRFKVAEPITRHGRHLPKETVFLIKKSSSRVHVDRWLAQGKIHEITEPMKSPGLAKAAKPKGKLSAAGRAKLAAAMKAKWAKRSAAAKPEKPAKTTARSVKNTAKASAPQSSGKPQTVGEAYGLPMPFVWYHERILFIHSLEDGYHVRLEDPKLPPLTSAVMIMVHQAEVLGPPTFAELEDYSAGNFELPGRLEERLSLDAITAFIEAGVQATDPKKNAVVHGDASSFRDLLIPEVREIRELPVRQLQRSPWNREKFDPDKEAEMDKTVKKHGILQPLIVRPVKGYVSAEDPHWEIVAGERRWRSAQRCNLKVVPCKIRELTDLEALEIQAIENSAREDLNPIDEARKWRQLLDQPGYSIETLCKTVGRKKSAIYERLTLLNLPPEALAAAEDGRLPASHAALVAKIEVPEIAAAVTAKILKPERPELGERGILSFRNAVSLCEEEKKKGKAVEKYREMKAEFEAKGWRVLSADESKELFYYGDTFKQGKGYVVPESWNDDAREQWNELLKPQQFPAPILAQTLNYKPLQIYSLDEMLAAAKKHKVKLTSGGGSNSSKAQEDLRPRYYEQRMVVFNLVREKIMMQLVNHTADGLMRLLRLVAENLISEIVEGECLQTRPDDIVRALGLPETLIGEDDVKVAAAARSELSSVKLADMRRFIAEVNLETYKPSQYARVGTPWDDRFRKLCTDFEIDLDALTAQHVQMSGEEQDAKI